MLKKMEFRVFFSFFLLFSPVPFDSPCLDESNHVFTLLSVSTIFLSIYRLKVPFLPRRDLNLRHERSMHCEPVT